MSIVSDRMNYDEFIKGLENSRELEWGIPEGQEGKQLAIRNVLYETEFLIEFEHEPWEKFDDFKDFVTMTHAGRNIEHATRVTGYFSKIATRYNSKGDKNLGGWNKGKLGELEDRVRSEVN